jgi:hypothetical protein
MSEYKWKKTNFQRNPLPNYTTAQQHSTAARNSLFSKVKRKVFSADVIRVESCNAV